MSIGDSAVVGYSVFPVYRS